MASKVFDNVRLILMNDTLDFTTQTFTAHLVTAEPAISATTVANLTLATGGNYAPVTLADISGNVANRVVLEGGKAKVKFANPSWANLTTNGTPITGMVLATGSASSATVISYVELQTAGGVATTYTPNGASFSINITNGVVAL